MSTFVAASTWYAEHMYLSFVGARVNFSFRYDHL